MFAVLLLFSVYISFANGADNATETVGWVSDPDGRGTFGLVLSCVVTLGLCVWSAMHLNIPALGDTEITHWINGIRWGFWGVTAPELVIFSAWKQYYSARLLQQQIAKIYSETEKHDEFDADQKSIANDWTLTHGFYAGMGGFVIDLENGNHKRSGVNLIPGHTPLRLTLTPRGVLLLAQCGLLPRITRDEIKDKSKADGIAKALVLVQAGWLIIQIIARVAQRLPVTLLEVNTLGHVVCAFIIYLMWWHKPRNIDVPTRLKGDWVKPLASYMLMSSELSGWQPVKKGLLRQTSMIPEMSMLGFFVPRAFSTTESKEQTPRLSVDRISSSDSAHSKSAFPGPHRGCFGPRTSKAIKESIVGHSKIIEQVRTPTAAQETQWQLAAQAYYMFTAVRARFTKPEQPDGGETGIEWFEPAIEELVVFQAGNWPNKALLNQTETLVMSTVVWFASILYGAVHIAAWNDHFPTTLEAWLWRSSAVFIAWSGAVWVIANTLTDRSVTILNCWKRILSLQSHWYSYAMLGTACTVCGICYLFARAYLVVEAFISMRSLPASAYDTPDWDKYLPHF